MPRLPETPTPGEEIRAIRQRLGVNVTQFATLLGCRRETVHRYEHETHTPPPRVLTLARLLAQESPETEGTPAPRRRRYSGRGQVIPHPPWLYVPAEKHEAVFILFGKPLPGQRCVWESTGGCTGESWRMILLVDPNRDPHSVVTCQEHFWQTYLGLQKEVAEHWKRVQGRQKRTKQRIRKQQQEAGTTGARTRKDA